MSAKVLAIGWEAADPALIERWCDAGLLPNLTALRAKWRWLRLSSTTTLSSGAAWPSILTGTSPAKHGVAFFHRQIVPGSYRLRKSRADDVMRDRFWRSLGDAALAFDLPLKSFRGVHVGDREEIGAGFGRHPLADFDEARPRSAEAWRALADALCEGVRWKRAAVRTLLEERDVELLFTVYAEPHWAGHFFWHAMDAHHPEHAGAVCDAMLRVYQELDATLADVDDDVTLVLFSSSGMGPNYGGMHLLPAVLARLGMGSAPSLRRKRRLLSKVPARVRRALQYSLIERAWDVATSSSGRERASTKAFMVPNDYPGAVRVNLRGREPHGLVAPGAEYDALCDELERELTALVNVDTGAPAVRRVIRVDRVMRGPRLGALPDLVVEWTGDAPIRGLSSPRIGTVTGSLDDERTGAHREHGFVLAAGPAVSPRNDAAHTEDATGGAGNSHASVVDLAPTILRLLDREVPARMDGRVLAELLVDGATRAATSDAAPASRG